jgi:alpha-1,6-mannosyltransferase
MYVLGAALCAALIICSRDFGDRGGSNFFLSLTVAGVAYLLALRELFKTPKFPRHVLVVGLVLSAVWHAAFLVVPAGPDDDIHRYVWDGRVQRLGYNPYVVAPRDPALADLHTSETRSLNNPDLPSPYPAGAQFFFRFMTSIHESTFAFKVAFVLCDLATIFLLLDVLRGTRQAEHWVLAFAWHPLLAIEVAGSGHVDIVGVLLLLASAAALLRRWRALAAVTLGLAVAVKFLPIVLLPLYWKRVRIRDAALAIALVGLLYLPFLDHGHIPFGSLGTYVQSFRFNAPVFTTIERLVAPQVAAAFALIVGFVAAIWMRRRSQQLSAAAFAWPMAASLLFAPVVYPWYLLWLLPFVRSTGTLPIIVWSLSIIPTYYVWHLRTLGQPWVVPSWALLLEYGLMASAAALVVFRQNAQLAAYNAPQAK